MKRLFIFLLLLLLHCHVIMATNPIVHSDSSTYKLSDSAFVCLITCGPGDEFYESFGHTALRVCDSVKGIDVVFNYGTFSFNEPFFYLKFAQGRLPYFLDVRETDNFLSEYNYYGRMVFQQRINLSPEETNDLFEALCINAKPENKYYMYDIFRNNCATRVDDMIASALSCRKMEDFSPANTTTYRSLLHKYTEKTLLWWRFGTDLLLGARCDRPLTAKQCMFVPMEMMAIYDSTEFSDYEKISEPAIQLLRDTRKPQKNSISPTLCFWLICIFIAALSLYARKRQWKLYWLDGIIFGLAAVISATLLFMWFGSDHWCTKWNLNLIWANPLFFWPLFRLRKPTRSDSMILIALLLIFIVCWPLWPQHFNSATLPIVLILLTRLSVRLFTASENSAWKHKQRKK
ncbi:MAG: DUF4105 domain-containing protein [Bacteroidales bacterium]|nr:DUF4105 domain-containing protein [Bacteroidales bacterium]